LSLRQGWETTNLNAPFPAPGEPAQTEKGGKAFSFAAALSLGFLEVLQSY
jgi:hypothetical protein